MQEVIAEFIAANIRIIALHALGDVARPEVEDARQKAAEEPVLCVGLLPEGMGGLLHIVGGRGQVGVQQEQRAPDEQLVPLVQIRGLQEAEEPGQILPHGPERMEKLDAHAPEGKLDHGLPGSGRGAFEAETEHAELMQEIPQAAFHLSVQAARLVFRSLQQTFATVEQRGRKIARRGPCSGQAASGESGLGHEGVLSQNKPSFCLKMIRCADKEIQSKNISIDSNMLK